MLLNNSIVDTLVHAVNHDGDQEAADSPDVLEVDPVVHKSILTVDLLTIFVLAELWLLLGGDEPGDVDSQANSNKVVHFEEKTKGTLFHLVDLGEELDELIHGLHAEVDEHEPVDVLHVSGGILIVTNSILISGLDEIHGHEFQVKGDDGEAKSNTHTDKLVENVEPVVSSELDPDSLVSTKELSLSGGRSIIKLIVGLASVDV